LMPELTPEPDSTDGESQNIYIYISFINFLIY
jgi:hypothetical protein